ncbi:mitochondrial carrier protein MTM1-like [Hibiscus syriacus]|uniref:mitochondrial carrier protein MTM1-like n=1 Tax=Hibiscus syriacus TaxID=106335 RepID=UPI00192271A9|nr:mitochondrial carrier protein MTM1-like [Hibiscus syriacus]
MITYLHGSEFCAPQRQKNDDASNSNPGLILSLFECRFETMLCNPIGQIADFGPNTVWMFADLRCSPITIFQYKGTFDVFNKIIRQEGFSRLWRGTNAGLALAVPTVGIYLPCYDIFRNWMEGRAIEHMPVPDATPYVPLVAGSLARSIASATCYPIELARTTRMQRHLRSLKSERSFLEFLVPF